MPSVNTESLKQVSKGIADFPEVLKQLSLYERMPRFHTTDIRNIRKGIQARGVNISPENVLAAFKAMQKLSLGELVIQPGYAPRFTWRKDVIPKQVGVEGMRAVIVKKDAMPAAKTGTQMRALLELDGLSVTILAEHLLDAEQINAVTRKVHSALIRLANT